MEGQGRVGIIPKEALGRVVRDNFLDKAVGLDKAVDQDKVIAN